MKKEQFRKLIKPIIKECIQEALVESNLISGIISEVVKGIGTQPQQAQIAEQQKKYESDEEAKKRRQEREDKLNQTRKSLLESINKDAYGGVDIFEGTTPMQESNSSGPGSALSGTDPNDAGVDISGILNIGGDKWSKLV
tara:strand:- start:1802 stop:2221 length:420 start_codon:yes stop_codon:yes gene_type:complete